MTKKIHLVGDDLYKKRYKSFFNQAKGILNEKKGSFVE